MSVLLRLSAGLVVWAVAFCLLYGLHGIGCTRGWADIGLGPASLHRGVLVVAWLACVAAGIGVALWLRSARDTLLDRAAWHLALVGVAATLVTGLPILTLPACV